MNFYALILGVGALTSGGLDSRSVYWTKRAIRSVAAIGRRWIPFALVILKTLGGPILREENCRLVVSWVPENMVDLDAVDFMPTLATDGNGPKFGSPGEMIEI